MLDTPFGPAVQKVEASQASNNFFRNYALKLETTSEQFAKNSLRCNLSNSSKIQFFTLFAKKAILTEETEKQNSIRWRNAARRFCMLVIAA